MSKIIIEIKATKTFITYESNDGVMPICDFDKNGFNISETTNKADIKLISELIYRCGRILRHQVIELDRSNKPLNKPTDSK